MSPENHFDMAVYEVVVNYLRGDLSADQLADWLIPRYWDALEATADGPLLGKVMDALWPFQEGHVTEFKFRELLEASLSDQPVPA